MTGSATSLIAVLFLLVTVVAWVAYFARGQILLERWAAANGYALLHCAARYVSVGTPFYRTGKGRLIYRVKVRDRAGRERSAYVRCGGPVGGALFSSRVDVVWDD